MDKKNLLHLIDRLYLEDEVILKNIPKEIVAWVIGVMVENFEATENEDVREKVVNKIVHTREVVKAGMDIINGSPEEKWDFKLGLLICFLHDIGRFPQVQKNTFSDKISGVDHACTGMQMIRRSGFGNEVVEEAVFNHSRKEYSGGNKYAKFIRDADKSAIFRVVERLAAQAERRGFPKGPIGEVMVDGFEKKISVDTENIRTRADWILFFGIWLWDLNFEITRIMACKEKFPEKIIRLLTEEKLPEKEMGRIKTVMLEFKEKYGIQKN